MNEPAPTEEAKLTAVDMRKHILGILERSIENDWNGVIEKCRTVALLADHCRNQEKGWS